MKKPWMRWTYCLSGALLVLPAWYFYQSLNPRFPAEWPEQKLGPFTAAPMPANEERPYRYDGKSYKDFTVRLCAGCMERLRTAYLSVGPAPAPIPQGHDGLLHGADLYPEAHAPFPAEVGANDRLWLSVQEWNGQLHHASWPLPASLR